MGNVYIHTWSENEWSGGGVPLNFPAVMCFPIKWEQGGSGPIRPFNTQMSVAHYVYWNWLGGIGKVSFTLDYDPYYNRSFEFPVERVFLPDIDEKEQIIRGISPCQWGGAQIIIDGIDTFTGSLNFSLFKEETIFFEPGVPTTFLPMGVEPNGALWRPTFVFGASMNAEAGSEFSVDAGNYFTPSSPPIHYFEFDGTVAAPQFGQFKLYCSSGIYNPGAPPGLTGAVLNADISFRPTSFINW